MACADGGADRRRHGHAGGLRRRTGEIGGDSVDDSGTIFYQLEKDIVRLADLLGHSNVETTRIYTIETGVRHREGLNAVGQILFTT